MKERKRTGGRGRLNKEQEIKNAVLSASVTGTRAADCKGASGPDAGSESSIHRLIPVPRKHTPKILRLAHLL
jgi:hypothetical protein